MTGNPILIVKVEQEKIVFQGDFVDYRSSEYYCLQVVEAFFLNDCSSLVEFRSVLLYVDMDEVAHKNASPLGAG